MENTQGRSKIKSRLLIAVVFAIIAIASYYFGTRSEFNEVTKEDQRVALTKQQEIQLGLQAAPQMMKQYGGLDPDNQAQILVDRVGARLVQRSDAARTGYKYEFHLLDDNKVINAFALPGGQIFITEALYRKLQSEDEVAGVLGHEIAHVVARHSAQQMAKAKLTEGLTKAAVIAATDPEGGSQNSTKIAQMIGFMVNTKFGRDHELQSDDLGVKFMVQSGYKPEAMLRVMTVLKNAGGGGARPPEFFSTHPNPDRRMDRIREAISKYRGLKR